MLSFLSTLRKRLIRSGMVYFFKSYVNGALSNTEHWILDGIPQGTILGPLLVLIKINDLPNCLKFSDTQMYADATSITMASESCYEIETKMNNIYEWLIEGQ